MQKIRKNYWWEVWEFLSQTDGKDGTGRMEGILKDQTVLVQKSLEPFFRKK